MPYLRTLFARALISGFVVSSVACGDDDGNEERDGSVNAGENGNGANGGTSGNNDGTNGSGGSNNGSGGANNGSGGANNGNDNGSGGANNGNDNGSGSGGTAGGTNGELCGGFAGAPCPDGYFCNVEEAAGGAGCSTADGAGVCQAIPTGCPGIYAPVCSCDIRTHSNQCVAHSTGSSVLHEGACTAAECMMIGGRVVPDPGVGVMCKEGEIGFAIGGGIEPDICCVKE